MSDEYPNVETTTPEQLRTEIALIEELFPQFIGLKDKDLCCGGMGCAMERARANWGDDAAKAWNARSSALWLLGEDE